MLKRLAIIVASAMLILSVAAVPAMAQTRVSINIGHPVHRVAAPVAVMRAQPYRGYAWQPAHYVWTAYGYQLVPGMWAAPSYVAPPTAYVAEPVYVAPQMAYVAPRYVAPRYVAPQYVTPRYVAPRYVAPLYVAPRYVAPRYIAPRYVAPSGVAVGVRVNNGHGRRR